MPRTRSVVWAELKLGIVGVVALVLLVMVVLAVGGQGGFFWQRYGLKARFNDVLGLRVGAAVRVSGKDVGKVTDVQFSGPQVEVSMEVSRDVRPLITSDSVATIGSVSLLGESMVEIKASPAGVPIADWGYVNAGPSARTMSELSTTASDGLDKISGLLTDLRAGRGTLGKLVTDETLYKEMEQFIASAGAVTKAINSGKGTLGQLVQDPSAYKALKTALENLQSTTERLNSGQGPLARLLNDQAMGASLGSTTAHLEQITGKLDRGEGTAGKLLTDRQMYDHLNSLTSRVDDLIKGLNDGHGTAGQLLHDQQLYDNMNRAVTELRGLLADVRKDPKKYLHVSVSIF
jgi:phospholipid/cholesterol/gamma-HCH transport system substrate-binding protein